MKKFSKNFGSAIIATSLLVSPVAGMSLVHAETTKAEVSGYNTLSEGQSILIRDGLYERHNLELASVENKSGKVVVTFNYSSRSIIKEGYVNGKLLINNGGLKKVKDFSAKVKYLNETKITVELDAADVKGNDGSLYLEVGASNEANKFYDHLTQKFKMKLAAATEEPTAEEPTSEEPTAEEPTGEEPTAEEPTAEEPTSGPGTVIVNNENTTSDAVSENTGFRNSASIIEQDLKLFAKQKPMRIDRLVEMSEEDKARKEIRPSRSKNRVIVKDVNVGDTRSFNTFNFETNRVEKITATLQYKGTKGLVWVADRNVTRADAEKLGKEYDSKIVPLIHDNFGEESDLDGNGHVNILLYDIQDGFGKTSQSYTGGYFYGGDLKAGAQGSNNMEIFYMDTYPSMGYPASEPKDVTKIYSTVAHEFQHMVNYNQKEIIQNSEMDTYLNEAFSMAAEHIYQGPIQDRIDYYNNARSIQNGHSLTNWSNYGDTLSNYSLSYLFGQYLNEQAGIGDKVYKEVIAHKGTTEEALQAIVHKYVSPTKSLGSFMTDFRIALIKHDKSGKYSLGSEPEFQQLRTLYADRVPTSLLPQASVAIKVNDLANFKEPTSKGQHITYTKVK